MLYIYIVTALLLLILWFVPKHMERRDIFVVWIFVSYIEITVDLSLGHIMDLYYFAGEDKISPEALAVKMIMSPLFGILFLNFMPIKFIPFIPYWIFWGLFSTFFEWTTVYFGYLTYQNWKLWYSVMFYILIFPLIRWFYFYIKHGDEADFP